MSDKEDKPVENTEESGGFDFGKKKKKKNKIKDILKDEEPFTTSSAATPAVVEDDAQKKLQDLTLNQAQEDGSSLSTPAAAAAVEEEEDFSKLKKKPKDRKVKFAEGDEEGVEFDSTAELQLKVEPVNDSQSGWLGSERDYSYDELLERVFKIMKEKNPDIVTGEKKKFIMRPPQIARVGTKKTSITNFGEICRLLRREERHLLNFLLAELGTSSGSLDTNKQLTIRGRFSQKQIENVLRSYIKEYVTCHTCRSPDTHLVKEERIFFLQCETCKSRCSVASIKSGFQAQVSKRAAQRAKAT